MGQNSWWYFLMQGAPLTRSPRSSTPRATDSAVHRICNTHTHNNVYKTICTFKGNNKLHFRLVRYYIASGTKRERESVFCSRILWCVILYISIQEGTFDVPGQYKHTWPKLNTRKFSWIILFFSLALSYKWEVCSFSPHRQLLFFPFAFICSHACVLLPLLSKLFLSNPLT